MAKIVLKPGKEVINRDVSAVIASPLDQNTLGVGC